MNIVLSNLGFVCSLGTTHDEIVHNAKTGNTDGMFAHPAMVDNHNVPFGAVNIDTTSTMRFCDLARAALQQLEPELSDLRTEFAPSRLGTVIGASNTAVHEAQKHISMKINTGHMPDDFSISQLELGTPATWVQSLIGFLGPALTISTACSSSIKAMDTARDLIISGVCDAVLCGGIDARCDFALNGFNALDALSHNLTCPMSENRCGINLGECAALFIMRRGEHGICIKGIGQSADAYHPTAPNPSGAGAIDSIYAALNDAHMSQHDIDYIIMHGTGTVANDAMESLAINHVFGKDQLCASTKPLTGHCLGAAGACSAALGWLMIRHQFSIPHIYDGKFAHDCAPIRMATNTDTPPRTVLCNAFAFGGSNSTLIMGTT